jgi:hypothetical protein
MSIATDEAEEYFLSRYWPGMEPNGDYLGKECHIEGVKSSDIQEAYEQGRTAEPTEAEIEAADKAVLQAFRDNSNMLSNRESVYIALEAARKAVAGMA